MLAGCFPDAVSSPATMRKRHAGGDISPGNEVRREETNTITSQHNSVPLINAWKGTFLQSGDRHFSPLFLLICRGSEGPSE